MEREVFGQRIRQAREKLGLSQEELALRISRSQYAVSEYESGKRRIYAHDLPTVARALEVPVSYFFEGIVPPDHLEQQLLYEFRELPTEEAKKGALELVHVFRKYANPE